MKARVVKIFKVIIAVVIAMVVGSMLIFFGQNVGLSVTNPVVVLAMGITAGIYMFFAEKQKFSKPIFYIIRGICKYIIIYCVLILLPYISIFVQMFENIIIVIFILLIIGDKKVFNHIVYKIIRILLIVLLFLIFLCYTWMLCKKSNIIQLQNRVAVEHDVNGSDEVSKDPLEVGWTMGKFGYFEPPVEMRIYQEDPITHEMTKRYRVAIHDNKYGDLDISFDEDTGKRAVFKAGMSASGRLAVFGASVKKSTSEMLQDLREGEVIADTWGN